MGAVFGCCEADATQYGLDLLKNMLEGQTKMVQPDPRIDPEVYVTFLEISAKEGAHIKFSPLKFSLRDIIFRTSCEIVGDRSQLAAAAAAKAAGAAASKLGASQDITRKVVGAVVGAASKALAVKDLAKDKLGMTATGQRTVKVDVTVDLVKEFSVEKVQVVVKDVRTKFEGGAAQEFATAFGEKVLSNKSMRRFLENAISDKASEIASR